MKRETAADAAMAAAVLCLGASLVFAGTSLLRHRFSGDSHAGPLSLDELLGAAAAGVGGAVALWWLLALLFACISAVAQAQGLDGLARATAAWSPAFMRRLVAVVLGLNLLSAPLAMASTESAGSTVPEGHASTVATAQLASGRALAGRGIQGSAAFAGPNAGSDTRGDAGINPAWTPQAPSVDPGPLARPATRPDAGATTAAGPGPGVVGREVVVQTGDSLWSIVASSLGPHATDVEVAEAWPQWYRTNVDVIGADPNFILPGQILHSPAG
ncbi:MAG: hypothetical protein WBX27_10235 [Specibacter sp.]